MFNNQDFINNLIKTTINTTLANTSGSVDTSTLISSILDDLNEHLATTPNSNPETVITQLVNNNTQIQQILTASAQLKANPSDSQDLTPNKVYTQPNFQFGVNISLDDLSTAIRKLLIEEFNTQFNTNYLYTDFSFTTVPAKETFQCAYLLNKDNIYLRVDVNTFYGSSFTDINSFTLNTVAGNNTDIIYSSTGIMGNDIYKLGNLEFKKYCQVVTTNPVIYQDVFIPIVLFDNIPYANINYNTDYNFTISQYSYDLVVSTPIKRPSFYLDSSNNVNVNIIDSTQLINTVSTYNTGETAINVSPVTISNAASSSVLNLCNTKVIIAQNAGFQIFDYSTGASSKLNDTGYPYVAQSYDGVLLPSNVNFGGVVTDADGTCLPIYFYDIDTSNRSLYNTNVSSNTTYEYTLTALNNAVIPGNVLPINGNEINSITVPNFRSPTSPASNYDRLCNSQKYSPVKDFAVMVQVNTLFLNTGNTNVLDINLFVANARDAYYNNINLDVTDILNTYFAKYVAQITLNFVMPIFKLDKVLPVITSIDSSGYANLAILVYLSSSTGYYIQGMITLTKNFQAQDFFILEKIYNEGTSPLNYRQSNYVLQPVNIAGTCTSILMAVENTNTITTDTFTNSRERTMPYYSLVNEHGILQLLGLTKQDPINDSPLKLHYTPVYNTSNMTNNVLISKLMSSDGTEPLANNITPV